jgi:hypothetical protein
MTPEEQKAMKEKEILARQVWDYIHQNWKSPPPVNVGDGWQEIGLPPLPQFARTKLYQKGPATGFLNCMVELRIKQDDPILFPDGRYHLSISHNVPRLVQLPGMSENRPGRFPTWDEIKEARYKFVPKDLNMAIMFPPEEMYYNLHETCLHLLQVPVDLALDPRKRGGI